MTHDIGVDTTGTGRLPVAVGSPKQPPSEHAHSSSWTEGASGTGPAVCPHLAALEKREMIHD